MRHLLASVTLIAALALLGACDGSDPAKTEKAPAPKTKIIGGEGPPRRQLGQWQHVMTARGQTQTMTICLDDKTEQRVSWLSTADAGDCSEREFARQADGTWTFFTVCKTVVGGETTTSGAAKGDFTKDFTVMATITTVGANEPRANGTVDMAVRLKHLGPCPAGHRGGDVQIAGMPGVRNIMDQGAGR
ncbi:MAG TPA: DUF3617 family protein [Caulobacter sp.]|nr:DUF3617 family protein [Caulobacter sp.]